MPLRHVAAYFRRFRADSRGPEIIICPNILDGRLCPIQDGGFTAGCQRLVNTLEIGIRRRFSFEKRCDFRSEQGILLVRIFFGGRFEALQIRTVVKIVRVDDSDAIEFAIHGINRQLQVFQVLAKILILHERFVRTVEIGVEFDQDVLR